MSNEERAQRLTREIPGIAAVGAQREKLSPGSLSLARAEGPAIAERLKRLPWKHVWFGQPPGSHVYFVTDGEIPQEFGGLEALRTEEYDYEFRYGGTLLLRFERKKEVEQE